MTSPNPFEQHKPTILAAASVIYRAEREGIDPNPDASRVNIMPQNLGDMSPDALVAARHSEAEANVAARSVARLAILSDAVDRGGARGQLARVEVGLTKLFERHYVQDALTPGGLVDTIRGVRPPTK